MVKTKRRRGKHIPQRTCIGCRNVQSKREMIRIVRSLDGIEIETDKRLSGRGAYLHADKICWEKALDRKLAEALRTDISPENKAGLREFMNSLAS